jgi:hypothetical protein
MPKPQRHVNMSLLLIPATPPDFLDVQNGAHGSIRDETYYSAALGKNRQLLVYTPPAYERSSPPSTPALNSGRSKRILRQYWGDRNVPEDMSQDYLHSKERVFSLCGQIVASLILSVSNVPLYRPLGPGEAKADLAASVSEAGGLGSLN